MNTVWIVERQIHPLAQRSFGPMCVCADEDCCKRKIAEDQAQYPQYDDDDYRYNEWVVWE